MAIFYVSALKERYQEIVRLLFCVICQHSLETSIFCLYPSVLPAAFFSVGGKVSNKLTCILSAVEEFPWQPIEDATRVVALGVGGGCDCVAV